MDELDKRFIRVIIRMGAEKGIRNVSSGQLAALCGVANGTVLYRHTTMQALLDTAAQFFGRSCMKRAAQMAEDGYTAGRIWDIIL